MSHPVSPRTSSTSLHLLSVSAPVVLLVPLLLTLTWYPHIASIGRALGRSTSELPMLAAPSHPADAGGCTSFVSITQGPPDPATSNPTPITVHWGETPTVPACLSAGIPTFAFSVNDVDRTLYFSHSSQPDGTTISTGQVPLVSGTLNTLVASVSGYDAFGDPITVADTVTTTNAPAPNKTVVSPQDEAVQVMANAPAAQLFTVTNITRSSATFSLSTTCTGAVSACAPSASSVVLARGDSASVTVAYQPGSAGSTGYVALVAVRGTSSRDSGWVNVTAVASPPQPTPQPMVVNIDSVNPGADVERDLCLTIAVGDHAAAECGDLRIAHALPVVRTRNTARAPTLIYNSQHAHPIMAFGADVTLPSGASTPDSVIGTLVVNGASPLSRRWSGAEWGATTGRTRRIGMAYDAQNLATGIYSYSLSVAAYYGSTAVANSASSASGQFVVVNRKASAFGAGWWLAGLEWIDTTSMLWIGGDGSSRKYAPVPGQSGVWFAKPFDRPDTLKTGPYGYVRILPQGLRVHFDAGGRHVATINRYGDTTRFGYVTGTTRLQTIDVPAYAAGLAYQFHYDALTGRLDSATAPGISARRRTRVTMVSGRVTAITDPDDRAIAFGYDPTIGNRILARTDKRGFGTTFTFDDAGKVRTVARPEASTTTIYAQQSRGFDVASASSVDTGAATTKIDGPRSDVPDTVVFRLNRDGAPVWSRIYEGNPTRLERADPTYPALVTKTIAPNGFVTTAAYDARGRVDTVRAINLYGDGRNAVTTYTWDDAFDLVRTVKRPEGDGIETYYENGLPQWVDEGRGKTWLTHQNGLLVSIQQPGQTCSGPGPTGCDSLKYDALGNLERHTTPLGYRTEYVNDAIGRTKETRQQVDVSGTPRMLRTLTYFDVMSRDTMSVTGSPDPSEQTVTLRRKLDAAGTDSVITRQFTPDTANIGAMVTRILRDGQGRPVKQIAPDGAADSTVYDASGNVIKSINRNGHSTTFVYDGANRLRRRSTDSLHYELETLGMARANDLVGASHPYRVFLADRGLSQSYPWGMNGGYALPAVVDTFAYDPVSQAMTDANNAFASIHFDYFPNGQLRKERSTQQPWVGGQGSPHVYETSVAYDRNGRRKSLTYPAVIAPTTGATVTYYYGLVGGLDSLRDLSGNITRFAYNERSQLIRRQQAGQVALPWSQRYSYDNDGNLASDTVEFGTNNNDFRRAQRFNYDARGKRTKTLDGPLGIHDVYITDTSTYSVLGYLLESTHSMPGFHTTTSYQLDGLGNMVKRSGAEASVSFASDIPTYSIGWNNGEEWQYYQPGTGRLWYTKRVNESLGAIDTVGNTPGGGGEPAFMNWYDAAGNLIWTGRSVLELDQGYLKPQKERRMYYGADGKLRAVDARGVQADPGAPEDAAPYHGFTRSFEEYRYDALGRRVATRFDQMCDDDAAFNRYNARCATSGIRRTIWDGSHELGEIQVPDNALENDYAVGQGNFYRALNLSPYFGAVAYVYDGQIDQPLSVTRLRYSNLTPSDTIIQIAPFTFYPLWDVNGQSRFAVSTSNNNCSPDLAPGTKVTCISLVIAKGWLPYRHATTWLQSWQGSLMDDKRGAGELMYRRNRYYDSKSARFTQEDPIGLAGGLNLYGFAEGDPVNLSDPFGLCPPCTSDPSLPESWGEFGNALWDAAKALVAVGTLFTPGPEEIVVGSALGIGRITGASRVAGRLTRWGHEGQARHNSILRALRQAGTHEKLGDIVPTRQEAERLIHQSGGVIRRIERGHRGRGHSYPHINYITKDGKEATIRVESVGRQLYLR